MIRLYTTASCASCRKAKKWLEDNNLEYREINLFVQELKEDELKYILERTENGVEDIVSKRSKVIKENNIDIESMTLKQLLAFLQQNPSAIRRPIIVDEKRMQVGYNDDEIRVFIPREVREQACANCTLALSRGFNCNGEEIRRA